MKKHRTREVVDGGVAASSEEHEIRWSALADSHTGRTIEDVLAALLERVDWIEAHAEELLDPDHARRAAAAARHMVTVPRSELHRLSEVESHLAAGWAFLGWTVAETLLSPLATDWQVRLDALKLIERPRLNGIDAHSTSKRKPFVDEARRQIGRRVRAGSPVVFAQIREAVRRTLLNEETQKPFDKRHVERFLPNEYLATLEAEIRSEIRVEVDDTKVTTD